MMVIQVLLEIGGEAIPWDWILFSRAKNGVTRMNCFGALILGAVLGGLSLLVFPHALIPSGWMRIANLILAPSLSGYFSMLIAKWKRHDKEEVGFHVIRSVLFTTALVVVRFVYMQR